MTNKQTIDGVSRETIEKAMLACFEAGHGITHDQLRALLDAPAGPTKQEAWALQVEKELGIERLPAAQPQGEVDSKLERMESLILELCAQEVEAAALLWEVVEFYDDGVGRSDEERSLIQRLRATLSTSSDPRPRGEVSGNSREPKPRGEAVALQHMAVSEGGKLRWMAGRKMQDCELYAMPDGSAIRTKLYTEPSHSGDANEMVAKVVLPDGFHKVIHDTLRNYRMGTIGDGEGGGYPLIDALSVDGGTVAGGIEECEYIADAVSNALLDEVAKLNGIKP